MQVAPTGEAWYTIYTNASGGIHRTSLIVNNAATKTFVYVSGSLSSSHAMCVGGCRLGASEAQRRTALNVTQHSRYVKVAVPGQNT